MFRKDLNLAVLCASLIAQTVAFAQSTGNYASVNGMKMYYEVHGGGEPVVLLHGAFMTITNNWTGWISELSKTRKVIAVEMQGHGRTADVPRDITYENLADDVAALLNHLKVARADPSRLQHGRSRGDADRDPPSGQSAKGSHHFVHVPP